MADSNRLALITGAAGLLGYRLVEVMSASGNVIAVLHSSKLAFPAHSAIRVESRDLSRHDETAALLRRYEPDLIVNCAAMTDVDGCEDNPNLARRINCGIVENIISEASPSKVRLVQLSTDYLFDGLSGPYPEDAVPNPVNIYGETKLEAERLVKQWSGSKLIVRTSALYDCTDSGKANLFASTYYRLNRGEQVVSASDAFCSPIWATNLAEAIAEAASSALEGVLNVAGPDFVSRYDFSRKVAVRFGYPSASVNSAFLGSMRRRAVRPLLAGLDSSKAVNLLHTRLLSPADAFINPRFQPSEQNLP